LYRERGLLTTLGSRPQRGIGVADPVKPRVVMPCMGGATTYLKKAKALLTRITQD